MYELMAISSVLRGVPCANDDFCLCLTITQLFISSSFTKLTDDINIGSLLFVFDNGTPYELHAIRISQSL